VAWIESHQSLSRHRKTLRAAALLGIDRHKLIGHLHELWWWALDNVPSNGALNGTLDAEIEGGAEWDGAPGAFVEALTGAGFIDVEDDGRFIHAWYEFAGKFLTRREDNRVRQANKRERDRLSSVVPSNAHVTRDSRVTSRTSHGATVPNPTQPNLPLPTEVGAPDADAPDAPLLKKPVVALHEPRGPAKPRGNEKVAAVVDALRAAGMTGTLTARDAKAIRDTEHDPEEVAALYAAIFRREYGSDFQHESLSIARCFEWLPGWQSHRAGYAPRPKTNGQYVQPITQQRNPGPAPLREPTPEEAAASTAEKERVRRQLEERHLAGRMARIGGPA
jgi:hypothetical protein